MDVCCECYVLSGRGLCDGPIPRLEELYRLWCVILCDIQTSSMRRPWPALGCCARNSKKHVLKWVISTRYILDFLEYNSPVLSELDFSFNANLIVIFWTFGTKNFAFPYMFYLVTLSIYT
jgi:hypothetical protein